MSNSFNLPDYTRKFHQAKNAGVITNGRGAIIEANAAAVKLMNVQSEQDLKGKLLVSYVHRRNVKAFQDLIHQISPDGVVSHESVWIRPRGSLPFEANLDAIVIMQSRAIVLICWDITNANALVLDTA